MSLKSSIKKLIPNNLLKQARPIFHGAKSYFFTLKNGFPARKLKIIGITGTKGKTTTSVFVGRLMVLFGKKTGYITTSVINTGKGEVLNPYKMTTIDSKFTQKYLSEMVTNGCEYAIIELSSQGLEQNRHRGLGGVDTGVFLNIYPEHIEAHGGFEQYKKAKSLMFKVIKKSGVVVLNSEFEESNFMLSRVPKNRSKSIHKVAFDISRDLKISQTKSLFKNLIFQGKTYPTNLIADFDIHNAYVACLTIANTISHSSKKSEKIIHELLTFLPKLNTVPGRMEWVVKDGVIQFKNPVKKEISYDEISIMVDYAHEPASMEFLLKTVNSWKPKFFDTVIHILSCDGAGRDDWKKPILGKISRDYSDFTIFTTDNYEATDNPSQIIELLQSGIVLNEKCLSNINREDAFKTALEIAHKSEGKILIFSTGVGSEQGLTNPKGSIIWDEREKWVQVYEDYLLS
jgi:UDP-N-acetylmuramoyl-L-alanyl-D-glutamate--2,6-diaminopimelate ligase